MKTSFTRLLPAIARSGWLPAITKTPKRRTALAACGVAAVCGGIAGPLAASSGEGAANLSASGTTRSTATAEVTTAATAATTGPLLADATKAAHGSDHATKSGHESDRAAKPRHESGHSSAPAPQPANVPAEKQLTYDYQQQINFYYCGPAATRIAVSAQGSAPSQDDVARQLGTTVNGTNSAEDTTRVLNSIEGKARYHTTAMPNRPTERQTAALQSDVVRDINEGKAVVANIAGTATDTLGGTHSYDGGHYLTVVGYGDHGNTVLIADPADPVADGSYWMHTSDVANWMTHHGYSS